MKRYGVFEVLMSEKQQSPVCQEPIHRWWGEVIDEADIMLLDCAGQANPIVGNREREFINKKLSC